EIQIGGVEVKSSTYEGHEATASVVVQSNNQTETPATLYLYQNGEEIAKKTERFTHGFNVVNFALPTDTEGEYDYEVRVAAADEAQDTSAHNNAYLFTQRITAKMDILLVSPLEADRQMIQELYGEEAEIEAYIGTPNVPTAVEDLCKYDEIVLSNVDVRSLNNATAFVDSVDKAVALFGKSLVTFGDTKLQNKENDDFQMLEDMLPVKFGNSDNDPKLYGIVIDTSRSMQFAYRFMMMKEAAIQLLNILNPDDYVTVISFSGEIEVLQIPTAASNRAKIEQKIRAIEPTQGTFLGKGLATAYELMKDLDYSEKQIMLISDGMSYTLEEDDPVKIAQEMKENNIFTSVINPNSTEGATALQNIANAGAPNGEEGRYYVIQDEKSIASLMFGEVANDVTETVIEERSPVKIKSRKDASVAEIETLPAVYGYVCSKAKANATTVLAVTYQRASGTTAEMPLYAHWSYGEGKVATFTSTLTGAWSLGWAEDNSNGKAFFSNVVSANTPEEKIDYPYAFNVEYDGTYSTVQVTPATLKADGEVNAKITMPDGETMEQKLTFDSTKYFYQFETPQTGKYSV
ncbi:MAG: VWA domain-containing protein, partial [Clostridia bacterium]|nr:VWA domain-containing protein [Clostridia bacterium]